MRFIVSLPGTPAAPTRLIDPKHSLLYGHNRCYHCPQCGKIWAQWEKEDPPVEMGERLYGEGSWYPFRVTCPEHALGVWTGDNPGSMMLDLSDIFVFPRAALEREFLIQMASRREPDFDPFEELPSPSYLTE